MVRELATLQIHAGMGHPFEEAFLEAAAIMRSTDGCIEVALLRCVEDEHRYQVSVLWRSVEDHVEGYGNSERRPRVRALIAPFIASAEPPLHFVQVVGLP